jgi:hypothetical protein
VDPGRERQLGEEVRHIDRTAGSIASIALQSDRISLLEFSGIMPDVPDSDNNPFSISKVSQVMLFQQHSLPFVMETSYLKTIT